jgi:protein-S-isoprenylcysteine O-methyltransferase Ste14
MVSLKRYPDTNLNAALLRFLSEARDRTIPHVLHWLQIIGWLVCVLYSTIPAFWLMIHPFAERWRARHRSYRRSPYTVLLPAWMAMWVVVALVTLPWRDVLLYRAYWTWGAAALLFAFGLYVYSQSGKNFSAKQLSGLPEIHGGNRDQRLVTDGIRSRVRHPVYLAHLCEMLAWCVGTGLAVCWGLTTLAAVTGAVMIRMEDAELEERFGDSYRTYRRSVPAILPRVWEARQL